VARTIDSTNNRQTTSTNRSPLDTALVAGGVAGLTVTAYIHLTEMSGKFAEVPYLGVGYALLVAACASAAVLVVQGDRRGWMLAGVACLATFVGFVLTRTTGLPASSDDVGNWSESIGTYSLVAEGTVVALSAIALGRTRVTA
jgi:fructose-1,6-bisphosphatase/inositol monophosphatase family enzyme